MRALSIAGCVALCINASAQNNIVGWEAYFDTDNGPGSGQWFPVTNDDTVSVAGMVDASTIGVGFHKLFVRYKTSGGLWSSPNVCAVYVQPDVATPIVHEVVACEYYVGDVDPGFGSGTPIPLDSIASEVYLQRDLDLLSLGLPNGNYFISIRYKSSSGHWSMIERRPFTVCDTYGVVADFRWATYGYNIVLENRSSDEDTIFWTLNGDTLPPSDILNLPVDSIGIYSVTLSAYNACLPAGSFHTESITLKGIRTVTPSAAGVDGVTTLRIVGAGFDSTCVVRLTRAGESDLNPIDSTTIASSDQITLTCTFDFHGVGTGVWNVVVEIPGDTTLMLDSALTIEPRVLPEVYTQLVGPTLIRNFRWQTYSLKVGNTGNIDARAVPVWLAISSNVDLEPLFEIPQPTDPDIDFDTIPHFILTDSLFGQPADYKLYGFIVPFVAGNTEATLNFRVRTSSLTSFKILHWASAPFLLTDSTQFSRDATPCIINPDHVECFVDLLGAIMPIPIVSCIINIVGELWTSQAGASCGWSERKQLESFAWGMLDAIGECAIGFLPWQKYKKMKEVVTFLFNAGVSSAEGGGFDLGSFCGPFIPEAHGSIGVASVSSFDPNEKYAPSRVANAPYFNSATPLTYTICFENVDTASAAAQTVLLSDSLDIERFDVSTLRITHVSFGDTVIAVQHAQGDFAGTIDLRPGIDVILSIDAYLDPAGNALKARFVSLDPSTLLPTDNPLTGFLLPNVVPPQGEGFLSFSIKALQTLADGDTLYNQASIVFDENSPMLTQRRVNIVDNSKPTSQVNPIPVVSTADSVLVDWSGGSDVGPAGIHAYNVYVNVSGGPWFLWKYNTSVVNAYFHGLQDSLYGFYSVAIDSALNVEDAPPTADTETLFDFLSTGVATVASNDFGLHPNPTTGNVFLVGRPDVPGTVHLTVFNSMGKAVHTTSTVCSSGFIRTPLDLPRLAGGTYLARFTFNGTNYQQRLVIIRD
ncbi:MAG: T9SS type A sorting domain-containing protein [Flavobacteriales bacterium]|nr:MAG: T9SS type A sorting domain-containing protein [Flavobacteriales bacterium]